MASFSQHVDSLDLHGHLVVVGLSALEGDTWDGGLQTLSVETGEIKSRATCETGLAMVRFAGQDGSLIACACDDGALRFYSARDLDLRASIVAAHDDIVSSVQPALSSNHLFSAGWDGNIKIWDLDHLFTTNNSNNKDHVEQTAVYTVKNAHHGMLNALSLCPFQPALFASGGTDGFFRLWDKRKSPSFGPVSIFGHNQAVSCVEFNYSVDNVVHTGTDAGEIFTLDMRSFKTEKTTVNKSTVHEGRVRRICSVPSRRECILSASDDTTVAISSIALDSKPIDGLQRKVDARFHLHDDYVTDLAVYISDSDVLTFLSGSTDKTVKLNDYKWKS